MSIAGPRNTIDINWRTIDIDALDPESSSNFDLTTLTPAITPISSAEVQTLAGQIRQLLRGGDSEGALRGALENVPYGADEGGKVDITRHLGSYIDTDVLDAGNPPSDCNGNPTIDSTS